MKLNKDGENVLSFKNNNVFGYISSGILSLIGIVMILGIFETDTYLIQYGVGSLLVIVGIIVLLVVKRTVFVANNLTQQINIVSKNFIKKEETNINFNEAKAILVFGRMRTSYNSRSRRSSQSIDYDVMLQTVNGDFRIYTFTKNISNFSALTSSFREGSYSPPLRISSKLREVASFIGVPYYEQAPKTVGETIRGAINTLTGNNNNNNQTSLNQNQQQQGFNQNN